MLRAFAAISLLHWLAACGAAAEVRLRSSAVCNTSVVRLADVSEIHGDDSLLAAALSDVPLCAAPAKGNERQFTQHDVRRLLELSGVESAAVQVTGSETVTLLAKSNEINATASKRPRPELPTHRQAVFEVELPGDRDPLSRQASASAVKPAAASEAPKPPRLVERGALCTVHARSGGIRITTQGKALQAGALGETISLEMADTKERILGRITGSQIVEVAVANAANTNLQPQSATALLPFPSAAAR